MLHDIAILTGGTVISSDLGYELKDATIQMLGRARQVKVTKENTTIVGGAGDKDAIADRIAQIRSQIGLPHHRFDREKLQERLAKAGWRRSSHQGRRCDRSRDEGEEAAHRGCLERNQGCCSGRHRCWRRHRSHQRDPRCCASWCDTLEGDERTGAKIVLKALEAPLRQIAKNAGLEGSVIINKIVSAGKPNYGYDAQNEVYVDDMIAAGIVDPTKVTRSALENAAPSLRWF